MFYSCNDSYLILLSYDVWIPNTTTHYLKKGLNLLNKPNDLFFTLAENAPVAIVVIDAAKTISYANQHAGQLIGENHENVLTGHTLLEYIAPEDTQLVLENIDRIKQRAGSLPFIITIITNKGIQKIVEVTLAATEATSEEQYIIYLRDISLHQKAEEEKFALERQLRAIYKMEALGQLASGIAHDLNNNLGAIAGYSELIKHIIPHTDEKVCKYANQISSAAARSAQVIQKVLTFARKNRMQVSSFNANDVVGDTINLIKPTFDKSITIEDRCEADHAIVTGDPEQIQNALLNLALNARDAMLGGGVLTISTRNVFVDEALAASRRYKMTQGYYLIISVSDTGSGMDQETQAHLFEPFFTTKEAGRGTGLGLASVYGSVKNHHGYIDVTSDVGKGSCFSLYLPVNRTVVSAENEVAAGDSDVAPAPKAHLLVIDDEQSIAEMLMELLSWLNYSATIFTGAAQAIDFYKSHQNDIDLAIIDMNMAEIDGLECFEKLKRINPKIKAMIATGYCLDDEREHLLKSGISGVLSKPFVSADLAKAVAEALAENN
jgi:two-component system, cell cycle sensor histidine kinase and response regulator CckA